MHALWAVMLGEPSVLDNEPSNPNPERQQLIVEWKLAASVETANAPVNMCMDLFWDLVDDPDKQDADDALAAAQTEDPH